MGYDVPDDKPEQCLDMMEHILGTYDTREECEEQCLPGDCPFMTLHRCEPVEDWDGTCTLLCEDDPSCKEQLNGEWWCICDCYYSFDNCVPL